MFSIIIVNWNGIDLVDFCFQSIIDQSFKKFEVIFVDNGSSDRSCEYVTDKYAFAKIIKLNKNTGFAQGNNEGFKIAKGQYIAVINTDVSLDKDWLLRMYETLQSDLQLGLCSSKILVHGTNIIDSVGDVFTTAFTGTKVGSGCADKECIEMSDLHGACAAAAVYRRKMLDEIGFFDEKFFLNHEDTDLNLRAWLSGWKCTFVQDAIAYHKVNATTGKLSDAGVYFFSRNSEWVWIKNAPVALIIRYLPQRILYEIVSLIYYGILKKKLFFYIKGKIDAVLGIKSILKDRWKVQKMIKLTSPQIKKGLMPLCKYLIVRFLRSDFHKY